MKLFSLALVAFLAKAASSAQPLSSEQLNSLIRSGKLDTQTLLKHAVPYHKRNLRKLEDEDGDEDDADAEDDGDAEGSGQQNANYYAMYGALGETGITGDHSVSFNSCVSLTVEEDWENLDNYEYLATNIQQEQIQSVRNYVLFNVCKTMGDCTTPEVSEENTYMVDLNTWVTAMIDYLPDQKDEYCEGCWNQQEYCMNGNAWQSAGDIDYSQAVFFYDEIKFQLIDCYQCEVYGCYDENGDAYEQNGWDDVDEWIAELAQCQETEYYFQGVQMNAGFMCNQYGTGLEIGIFMDESCTLYNSQRSYHNVLGDGDEDWANYGKSQRIINYLFNYMFDCYGGDLIYVNLFQQVYLDDNEYQYDPCQINTYTGEYLDEDACEEMVDNNPCYITYDEYGYQNEIDEDECAEFMEAYPCWTMPGGNVTADYQEACYEYESQYYSEANSACLALFGQGDDDEDNDNEDAYGGAFEATALSACKYQYAVYGSNGGDEDDDQDEEEDGDEQDNNAEYQALNWTASLAYDISYNMTDDQTAICNFMDSLFVQGMHLNQQAYDPTISGQMYSYEDLGSEADIVYAWDVNSTASSYSYEEPDDSTSSSGNGYTSQNTYFPTMKSMPSKVQKVVNNSRKMSPGAIAATALGTAAGVVLILLGLRHSYKSCAKKDEREIMMNDADQKELPLMT